VYVFEQMASPETRLYDIKLVTMAGKSLLFATTAASDQQAADHAKGLMLRHACDSAEVWCNMRLVRRL
jgi:hypothetical protein